MTISHDQRGEAIVRHCRNQLPSCLEIPTDETFLLIERFVDDREGSDEDLRAVLLPFSLIGRSRQRRAEPDRGASA
jgi:hypothetical protein